MSNNKKVTLQHCRMYTSKAASRQWNTLEPIKRTALSFLQNNSDGTPPSTEVCAHTRCVKAPVIKRSRPHSCWVPLRTGCWGAVFLQQENDLLTFHYIVVPPSDLSMFSVPHESTVVPEQVISLTYNPKVKRSLMLCQFLSSCEHFTLTPHFTRVSAVRYFEKGRPQSHNFCDSIVL